MIKYIKLIISIFFLSFLWLKKTLTFGFFNLKVERILILYYHSVSKEQINMFRWQLETLMHFGKIVPSNYNSSSTSKKLLFAITFDDGFNSILENAIPLLELNSIPYSIFIPTGYLGKSPNWENQGERFDSKEIIIDKEQILKLNKNLTLIGSHSVSHPNFLSISQSEQNYELVQSREFLNSLMSENIELFSFPYGAYDAHLISLAFDAGYKFVFTSLPCFSKINEHSKNHLRGRVPVNCSDSKIEFLVKIFGGYNWLPYYINFKKKIKSI